MPKWMNNNVIKAVTGLGFGALAVWSASNGLAGLPFFFALIAFLVIID